MISIYCWDVVRCTFEREKRGIYTPLILTPRLTYRLLLLDSLHTQPNSKNNDNKYFHFHCHKANPLSS